MTVDDETSSRRASLWRRLPWRLKAIFVAHFVIVGITFYRPAFLLVIAPLFGQQDEYLWRMFCWTGTASLFVVWLMLPLPRIAYTFLLMLAVIATMLLLYVDRLQPSSAQFTIGASVGTAIIMFACCVGGMRICSKEASSRDKSRYQFTLQTMMLMSAMVALFLAARIATSALTAQLGWSVCNTVLFSACNAGITVGLVYAVLRPKYLLVSVVLAPIVHVGMTALALYWMPVEEFPNRWGYWWVVGHQTLIHATYVVIPLLAARLLNYRITFQAKDEPVVA